MGNTCTSGAIDVADLEEVGASFSPLLMESKKLPLHPTQVNVLSYNIFIRPPFVHTSNDDYKDERLAAFAKAIDGFDIICLQEMFSSYSMRRSNFLKKAKEKKFVYTASSPKVNTFSVHIIDGGLQVLSKYPIVSKEYCPFSSGIGADYIVQKGVLYVKIAIGSSFLHLYTTHTQATYDNDPKYLLQRSEQFFIFHQFIKHTLSKNSYNESDLVLLTGDFNVDSRSQNQWKNEVIKNNPIFYNMPNIQSKEQFHEYDAMLSCLSDDHGDQIEDLIFKQHKTHLTTFGEYELVGNEKKPIDRVLTHVDHQCADECLDYIFKYTPRIPNKSLTDLVVKRQAQAELTVLEETAKVHKFYVAGYDFDQLSDHYGVGVSLQYQRNPELESEDSDSTTNTLYLTNQNESPNRSTKSLD